MEKAPMTRFRSRGWVITAVFCLLGLGICLLLPDYSFSGLVCIGIGVVILCYLLLPLLARKKPSLARVLLILLSVCLGIGILAAIVTGVLIWSASRGQPDASCAYVVVLGAGVNGTEPSMSLRDRLNGAYGYLTAHPNAVCVVSGGKGDGENISEAQCMYNELTAMGIDSERIWMEDQASNTRENLQFSLDLIEDRTGQRPTQIGLVTSEYHLYRAGLFAREQNVTSYGIPAKTGWISLRINYFLREIVAVWYYCILGG